MSENFKMPPLPHDKYIKKGEKKGEIKLFADGAQELNDQLIYDDLDNYFKDEEISFDFKDFIKKEEVDTWEDKASAKKFLQEYLMKKYQLESFEVADLARQSIKYQRGVAKKPLEDEQMISDLATWLIKFLPYENKQGLPLLAEEIDRLKDEEKEELVKLYSDRADIILKIGQINNSLVQNADKISNIKKSSSYSTAFKPTVKNIGDLKEKAKKLYFDLQKTEAKIFELERKAYEDLALKERKREEQLEAIAKKEAERLKIMQEIKEEKEYQKEKSRLPEYSKEDIRAQEEALKQIRASYKGERKDVIHLGKALTKEGFKEFVKEGAARNVIEGKMFQAYFQEKEFKGQRQLVCTLNQNGKVVKYYWFSKYAKPGFYAAKVNPARVKSTEKNPNFATAGLDIMIPLDKRIILPQRKKFKKAK